MKHKTSLFFFLAKLLILSATLVVPFAHADDSAVTFDDNGCLGGTWRFRLFCDASGDECEISQINASSPSAPTNFACWNDLVGNIIRL